jgi:hypothetical protein
VCLADTFRLSPRSRILSAKPIADSSLPWAACGSCELWEEFCQGRLMKLLFHNCHDSCKLKKTLSLKS